jgi:imidazolonepropionase-like amidohydrolase
MKAFLAVVLMLMGAAHAQDVSKTYVRCGHVVDPTLSDNALGAHTIIIAGDKIADVRSGLVEAEAGAAVVDLSTAYCLPGLVDAHTHMGSQYDKGGFVDFLTRPTAEVALRSTQFAARTLLAGFTTVRDAGGADLVDVALRGAIARGDIIGPRMYVAGNAISISGGHGDGSGGYREDKIVQPTPETGVADGVAAVTQATRLSIKRGADHIKFMASGGVLSQGDNASSPQFTQEEMNAIVGTARDHGLKTMAHAHGDEGARRAVVAGVASIEHGTYITDETYRLMKKNGTYLVPTLIAGMTVAENAKTPGFYPPTVAAKALEVGPRMGASFARAHKIGVKIAFGTDAAVFPHGQNAREFQYMVDNGMTPLEAIRASTRGAPELLGHFDKFGSLEKGKFADVIAVTANPLADVKALQDVRFVMKAGVVYKRDGKRAAP